MPTATRLPRNVALLSVALIAGVLFAPAAATAETRYVDAASAKPAEPYTTKETAAADIATALAKAEKGDTVQVAPGTYKVAKTLRVGKEITLVGAGADKTTIDAEGKCGVLAVSGTVKGFTITGGKARQGAGVTCAGGTVLDCTITGNTAERYGGGLHGKGGAVRNCTISNNKVVKSMHTDTPWGGGGLYIVKTTVENCLIKDNVAAQRGGGLWVHGWAPVRNCTIVGNRAGSRGGNRSMQEGGGGAFLDFGGMLVGCLIYGNSAGAIGGGAVLSTNGSVRNCTIVGNTAGRSGGGVQTVGPGRLFSSILTGNTRGGKKEPCDLYVSHYYHRDIHQLMLGKAYVKNCLIGATKLHTTRQRFYLGRTAGYSPNQYKNFIYKTEVLDGVDPQFVDAAAHNYRVKPTSPCVNAGLADTHTEGTKDIDGNPRIRGESIDIGAYELQAGPVKEPAKKKEQ